MALTIAGGGAILHGPAERSRSSLRRPVRVPSNPFRCLSFARRDSHIVAASKKFSSRAGKFDSKNKRNATATTEQEEELRRRTARIESDGVGGGSGAADVSDEADDGYFLPELPGEKPDFWEGPQWEPLGFFVQYLWAFGIVFALIACGIAVATYNEGATDFKETPAYKESIQSRELLEEPEASNSDVFESNPTEEAPSLE